PSRTATAATASSEPRNRATAATAEPMNPPTAGKPRRAERAGIDVSTETACPSLLFPTGYGADTVNAPDIRLKA
ncbi:hypothetical protein, partial [Streptomyces rubiginosohelvolus]